MVSRISNRRSYEKIRFVILGPFLKGERPSARCTDRNRRESFGRRYACLGGTDLLDLSGNDGNFPMANNIML